jgi:uncharacterized protein (DUF3084 family)
MFTFGIRIILLLILISGAIALIGDYIGRAIGRRRLTLFKLRPRHTAFAITILTGILIALMTLGSMLIISQDARTALFGLEELRTDLAVKGEELAKTKKELEQKTAEREKLDQELTSFRNDLDKAKREIRQLERTREKLGEEIEVSRKGKLLFAGGEALITSVIQAGPEKEKLDAGLKQILSAADAYVRSFGIKDEKHLIFITPKDFEQAIAILQERSGVNIVTVAAAENTIFGEVVPVRFEIRENRLVYKNNQVIAEVEIPSALSAPEIEQEIKNLLNLTREKARKDGVIPDPTGSIGSIPYSQIFSLAREIKANRKDIKLKALAKKDIYAIDPLEIRFKIFYR